MCHHHDRHHGHREDFRDRPDHQHCGPDCRDRDRDRWDRDRGGRCRCEEAPRDRCECGCEDEGPFGFERQFVSKAELVEALEDYLSELEKEAQGVREAIADLRAEIEAATVATPAKDE